MKKQLLVLSLAAFAVSANAQVTITSADQAPMLSVFNQARDTTQTQVAGGSGPSQTYNYAALLNQQEDSLTFTNPNWTAYGSNYPNSNLCIMINQGDAYIFASQSATILEIDGQAADPLGSGIIPLTFSNPETQMVFPAAYGSSFGDTAGGTNQFYLGYDPGVGFTVDSVRIHTLITKDVDFDGWGSLTSPLGTFNVLRQNTFRKQIDTIDIYAFGNWAPAFFSQTDSARTYTFWTNGIGFPLVELTDQFDLGTITNATWLPSMPSVTGIPANDNSNNIVAYPNPVADVLTIQTTVEEGSIEVIDMTGRVVKTAVINSTTTRIDMTDLAAGMYTYRVVGQNQNGKVQVAH